MVEKYLLKLSNVDSVPTAMKLMNHASGVMPRGEAVVFVGHLVRKRKIDVLDDSCCLLQISIFDYSRNRLLVSKTVCWPLPIKSIAIDTHN